MIAPWLKIPDRLTWDHQAAQPGFFDVRNVGLIDAVQAGWYQNNSGELFRGFPITSDDIVVDVGCGAGGASLFCARQGAEVIFCDINPDNIDKLKTRIQETSARASQGITTDCAPLPLPDNYATRIISMEMLEHVDHPADLLKELKRIGQPGALYLISIPDATAERLQMPFAPTEYFQKPNHIHIFEKETLQHLVQDAGLEIIEQTSYGFFWNLWMCMYWVCAQAAAKAPQPVSHDCTQPPYFPLLDDFTSVWARLISLPEAQPMRQALDAALPKSQIIIARKPL